MDSGMLLHIAIGIYHRALRTSPRRARALLDISQELFFGYGAENIAEPDVKKKKSLIFIYLFFYSSKNLLFKNEIAGQ